MEIYTIGFGQKSAQRFFDALTAAGIRRLVDVRLNNTSQLAGFTKKDDLAFFLRRICDADYVHEPLLAPTQNMLDALKKNKGDWAVYERDFLALMVQRQVQSTIDRSHFAQRSVLLCSEPTPEQCHRRLVAEYLRDQWRDVAIIHL